MIITRDIIQYATCDESFRWFEQNPQFYNMQRKPFHAMLKQYELQGKTPNNWWADWAVENFVKADAIVWGKKVKRLGVYKIYAPNVTPQEFDNIDNALAVLEAAKNEHIKTEDELFQVQLRRRNSDGYLILYFCDTTLDTYPAPGIDEYYVTFNIYTGSYEEYSTYAQAKNRMIELRNNRNIDHAHGFVIHEKVAEVGDPDFNAEAFVLVQSLAGRKTVHLDVLDSVARRPDPKPKKP